MLARDSEIGRDEGFDLAWGASAGRPGRAQSGDRIVRGDQDKLADCFHRLDRRAAALPAPSSRQTQFGMCAHNGIYRVRGALELVDSERKRFEISSL